MTMLLLYTLAMFNKPSEIGNAWTNFPFSVPWPIITSLFDDLYLKCINSYYYDDLYLCPKHGSG